MGTLPLSWILVTIVALVHSRPSSPLTGVKKHIASCSARTLCFIGGSCGCVTLKKPLTKTPLRPTGSRTNARGSSRAR